MNIRRVSLVIFGALASGVLFVACDGASTHVENAPEPDADLVDAPGDALAHDDGSAPPDDGSAPDAGDATGDATGDASPLPHWLDEANGKWLVQINPAWPMTVTHYGPPTLGPMGVPNRGRAQTELASDLGDLTSTDFQDPLAPPNRTADALLKNGVTVLSRIADPDDPSQWAFRFFIDKNANGAANNGKYRVEVTSGGGSSQPWGTEEWGLSAFRLVGSGWSGIAEKDATILYQYHAGAASDADNPPFAVSVAGDGSKQGTSIPGPPGTHLRIQVRRQVLGDAGASEPAATGFVPTPPTDTWIWVITNSRSGYVDAAIDPPFIKCWIAIGNGAPQLVVDHTGRWSYSGSSTAHYPKSGMYYFLPALWSQPLSTTREVLTKGLYVLRASDVPGATVDSLLAQLRVAAH